MASQTAVKVAQATRVMAVNQKYTVQSTGIWETIRRIFAVDPTRSNGVPLNAQYRLPPPGSNEPFSFIDPVTLPAGDIAENPYWKRDARRNYPRMSVVSQGDVVGLLSVGSQEVPRKELVGEEGGRELKRVEKEGEGGLAVFFRGEENKGGGRALEVLGRGGLPPTPSGVCLSEGADKYSLTEELAFPEGYPCRAFK
ncbi:NADH-ubiquinone oxidoreductase 21.3 kDa subunit [Sclerotinia borealis F-4128]|uniref:NADH-ubiquinone oxidoreductase 21.3 kDa subunit n=1 Tax=Sclerotinia borealis (strain F-4128) TaxID=1432307 RepID=W9CNJ9_SCLBF|nr:NADH-ubiquinone oxidoreductase 21.3 kDa subunit [Sclerotinia borealis F-4128]